MSAKNSGMLSSLLSARRMKSNDRKSMSTTSPSVLSYFRSQEDENVSSEQNDSSQQFDLDETFMDTVPELTKMISVMEERKKTLEERKAKIATISDQATKELMLDLVGDLTKCVEDSDKILRCHNELVQQHNENSETISSAFTTVGNLATGVGKLTETCGNLKQRVQTLEVSTSSNYDNHFLNIILVDQNEASEIENGSTGSMQKFIRALQTMSIPSPNDLVDVDLLNVRKFVDGKRKPVKMLRARFNNSVTPGRILAKIIKNNKEKAATGGVKYYAEIPSDKKVWNLKRICFEMKNDGDLHSVRGSDRGILVSFKSPQITEANPKPFQTRVIKCEKDIDDLRVFLKLPDSNTSVSVKYSDDYWMSKRQSGNKHKRDRESDDIDGNEPKRGTGSNNQRTTA